MRSIAKIVNAISHQVKGGKNSLYLRRIQAVCRIISLLGIN